MNHRGTEAQRGWAGRKKNHKETLAGRGAGALARLPPLTS